MNRACPKGSTVEGYNKQGYAFKISILDSIKQTQYYFFLDSEDVIKRTFGNRGSGFAEYKLNYDSTDTNSLTLIEQHVFNTLSKFSDSLSLKKLDYLVNGKNFILVKQSNILKKK